MKTLKLKKDVVEQLSSNQANHAMGGVKTIETCMNCPIVYPDTIRHTDCQGNSAIWQESGCAASCIAPTYPAGGCNATMALNCLQPKTVQVNCAVVISVDLCAVKTLADC